MLGRAERSSLAENYKILRCCHLKGDGVHHAVLGIVRMHNLILAA